ncbi:MAG: glycogen/starch/alpha-glucan phosphorylase, partial [Clostridiales bacterium]|nr:glycogen/starch/alpha-glucan phosphorylase [Clostridiales bacterium]
MADIAEPWLESAAARAKARRAYYLSAEYLIGRMIYNNLYSLGIFDDIKASFARRGVDLAMFEDIEDAALGNGGLGRLAACFLDSAATMGLPLDGYGIRYTYGLFRQSFRDGLQHEEADDWQRQGDPWSRRAQEDTRLVRFADMEVNAVPYDMPVIGYDSPAIGTLRLFQAEAVREFDFSRFNEQEYDQAVREKIAAETITNVLYPNDSTRAGRV